MFDHLSSLKSMLTKLPKVTAYLLDITLISYISGFAITNFYLSSLGVVSFDILRARYILTGLLFLAFCASLVFLVAGFNRVIRVTQSDSVIFRVVAIPLYTGLHFVLVYLVVYALATFSRIPLKQATEVSYDKNNWYVILGQVPQLALVVLQISGILIGAIVGFVLLIALLLWIIRPSWLSASEHPVTRQGAARELVNNLWKARKTIVKNLAGFFVVLLSFLVAVQLLSTIIPVELVSFPESFDLPFNWPRFLVALTAMLLFWIAISAIGSLRPSEDILPREDEHVSPVAPWLYAASMLTILVLPLYAFGIYPFLPQHVGGGQRVPIEIVTNNEYLYETLDLEANNTYLVDRTSDSIFLLVEEGSTGSHSVIEISDDAIDLIIYIPNDY